MDNVRLNQQIRMVVDPLILKLREQLFGSTYNTTIVGSLVPPSVIRDGADRVIEEAVAAGSLVRGYVPYIAGSAGVTAGRALYFDGSTVNHADCTIVAHAGKLIGVALETVAAGATVNVQTYGFLEIDALSFSAQGAVFVGLDGALVNTPAATSTFIQIVGVALSAHKMLVDLDKSVIMV